MEGTNGSTPRSEAVAAAADWRPQILPAERQTERQSSIDKILETLLRHLPGIAEVRKIAERFEEKIYNGATSKGDYVKKISVKMVAMESKSEQAPADLIGKLQNLNLESEIEEDQKH